MTKKYYIICTVKKKKYRDYKKLLPKYTTNSNNFFIKIKTMLIKSISIL